MSVVGVLDGIPDLAGDGLIEALSLEVLGHITSSRQVVLQELVSIRHSVGALLRYLGERSTIIIIHFPAGINNLDRNGAGNVDASV